VRHFERFRGFLKKLSENWRLLIKITRLFEDIFREMEVSIRNLRLFQRLRGFLKEFSIELRLIESEVRLFQRILGFFKLFSDKWRFFSLMWDILKDFEAFKYIFKEIKASV
jgi:hypothetical protein